MWENINCGDFINCGRLSSLLWVGLNAIFIKSPVSVCFSHYLMSFGLASSRPQKLLAKSEQVDSRAKLENRLCGTLKRIEAPISHIWLRDWG